MNDIRDEKTRFSQNVKFFLTSTRINSSAPFISIVWLYDEIRRQVILKSKQVTYNYYEAYIFVRKNKKNKFVPKDDEVLKALDTKHYIYELVVWTKAAYFER